MSPRDFEVERAVRGRNVTSYLESYLTEATIHKFDQGTAVKEFLVLIKAELASTVKGIADTTEDWEDFDQKMKEEFQAEDAD